MMRERITGSFRGFLVFVREQGVMGLAIGFILGTAVSKVVSSFVGDILDPLLALLLGSADTLTTWTLGPVRLGAFLSNSGDFVIIAAVVYAIFRALGLEKIELKKL